MKVKLFKRIATFSDKENKKTIEYEEFYSICEINGLKFDIIVKFKDKTSKDLVSNNIANCEIDTKLVEYTKQDGTPVAFTSAICKCALNGTIYEFDITLKSNAEIYLIDVMKTLK